MAVPSKKEIGMEKILDEVSNKMYGRKRTGSIKGNICITCGDNVDGFRDRLSEKEYTISGMCQKCQDSVFGA
jgi:hypothetical protein